MNIYIRTSDPARNVLVPRTGAIRIVAARPVTAFHLTNTLRAEARAVAAAATGNKKTLSPVPRGHGGRTRE